jgi:hypothetical protein
LLTWNSWRAIFCSVEPAGTQYAHRSTCVSANCAEMSFGKCLTPPALPLFLSLFLSLSLSLSLSPLLPPPLPTPPLSPSLPVPVSLSLSPRPRSQYKRKVLFPGFSIERQDYCRMGEKLQQNSAEDAGLLWCLCVCMCVVCARVCVCVFVTSQHERRRGRKAERNRETEPAREGERIHQRSHARVPMKHPPPIPSRSPHPHVVSSQTPFCLYPQPHPNHSLIQSDNNMYAQWHDCLMMKLDMQVCKTPNICYLRDKSQNPYPHPNSQRIPAGQSTGQFDPVSAPSQSPFPQHSSPVNAAATPPVTLNETPTSPVPLAVARPPPWGPSPPCHVSLTASPHIGTEIESPR